MSIRRRIEMWVDRGAAKKAEREMQESLEKGTKPNGPKKNIGVIGRAMEGLKSQALKFGAALAAAFALNRIKQFGKAVLDAFGRQEHAVLRVNSALINMGKYTDEASKMLQENAAAIQRQTRAGDEAILEATATIGDLAKELNAGELAKAQEAVVALADTFFKGDLGPAAQLLAKTIGSSTNALSRYGIEIDATASQSEKLNQVLKITGSLFETSKRSATDLAGREAQLKNSSGDLEEAIGGIITRGLGLTDGLGRIREMVDQLTASLTRNQSYIAGWGRFVVRVVQAVFETFKAPIRAFYNLGQVAFAGLELAALHVQQVVAPTINKILGALDKIPHVNIPFRMNELTPEEFRAEQARITADIDKNSGDLADTVFDLANAYRDVGQAAVDAARGQAQVGAGGVWNPDSGGAPPTPSTDLTDEQKQANARWLRHMQVLQAAAQAAREYREGELEKLKQKAGEVADAMTSAFQGFFEASTTGFQAQGGVFQGAIQAARQAGAAIIGGLIKGRAEEEVAAGTAALAAGTWPPNPAAIFAGLKHFAAAALYRAIPGVIGGGGGGGGVGISGGGVAAAALPRGAIGTQFPGTQQLAGPEVNIFIDPLNPSKPAVQRFVQAAVQNAKETYGDNVTVNVRPRTGAG